MLPPPPGIRRSILVLASIGLLLSPLGIQSSLAAHSLDEEVGLRQITFVPSLSPLELTALAGTSMPTVAPQPTLLPTPIMISVEDSQYAVAGDLEIGGRTYPIGDEISDASGIPLGATEEGSYGDYGYAVVRDHTDYRLLWTTDEDGTRHSIIVHRNDPLFAGEDGFRKHIEDLQRGMNTLVTASTPVFIAGGTLLAFGFGACPGTAGAGCAGGVVAAGIAGLVGLGIMGYIRATQVDTAIDNLGADFATIAPNRGVDSQH